MDRRTVLITLVLIVIPVALVALLYPVLPVLEAPRIGMSGSYFKTVDKPVYFLFAFVPVIFYYRLR